MTLKVKMLKMPSLREPYMVCGLPGSGYVGKLAADHLANELKAELFGEIYSYSFPPQVTIKHDGSVDLIKNELYSWVNRDKGRDLIIFTGDSQPIMAEAEYEVVDKVTEIARSLGVGMLFTLAAFITGAFSESPRVFGTATEVGLLRELEKYGVLTMNEGNITGMNGLLIGFAKIKNIRGACLLGETSGYMIDAKAAQSVLDVLTKIVGIKVDMTTLEQRSKDTGSVLRTIQEAQRRVQEKAEAPEELGYIS